MPSFAKFSVRIGNPKPRLSQRIKAPDGFAVNLGKERPPSTLGALPYRGSHAKVAAGGKRLPTKQWVVYVRKLTKINHVDRRERRRAASLLDAGQWILYSGVSEFLNVPVAFGGKIKCRAPKRHRKEVEWDTICSMT